MRSATPALLETSLEQMRADAVLPADVQPASGIMPPTGAVLLTGATGFVGAFLLHALLRETSNAVVCLVRPDRRGLLASSVERIRQNLTLHGLWEPAWAERIRPVAGDLRRPGLGWSERQQSELSESLDAVYHGAAAVNWVAPYAGLRAANVLGTLELLRLACKTRPKPFHYLSTLGVCYAYGEAGQPDKRMLTEADDSWPLLDQLHLGYAQSKAVGEELVRQARQRGLPAAIYRPALITGDSRSGSANPDDFLARGIGACVRMGCAPDVDWNIDACPVDHVARVVVRNAAGARGAVHDVLHLVHPQPRHWRELVLWMRLYGYSLRFVSYRDWLRRMERTARLPDHPLYPLLGFFRARVGCATLPETYMGQRRTRVSAERTHQSLADLGVNCPTLDAGWLERFFRSLTAQGVVPPFARQGDRETGRQGDTETRRHGDTELWETGKGEIRTVGSEPPRLPVSLSPCLPVSLSPCLPVSLSPYLPVSLSPCQTLPDLLRRYYNDDTLCVRTVGPPERLSHQSILTELTSWRCGSTVGLFRQRLELESKRAGVPGRLEVVIKVKTEDRHLLDVAEAAANLCDQRVGVAFARWRERMGLAGGHLREIALYGQQDERWRRFTPHVYAATWDDEQRRGLIVLESLSANVWMDSCTGTDAWQPAQIEAAVRGLAELHAIWFERRSELAAQPWLGAVFTASGMVEMTDLWTALADHAARYFVAWLGPDVRRLQRRLLARLDQWWRPLEQLPTTLVHNDFNPRNLALRQGTGGQHLCAYDWELATLGLPQHDLAELLCFVLPFDCSRETMQHYVDLHRQTLELAVGQRLVAGDWQHGFGLALADLLLNRWAMYTLVHAVRRQPFLERVLQTWRTLFAYVDPLR